MAAAMIIAKRAAVSNPVVDKLCLLSPVRSATAALCRSFANYSGAPNPSEERSVDVARRPVDAPVPRRRRGGDLLPTFFGDVFDPFSPRRSLSEVFNLVDQMLDFPFGAPRGRGGAWQGCDAREDDNALYLRVDMPGLGKEDVRVTVEQNVLVIRGEAAAEEGEKGGGGDEQGGAEERERARRRYSSRIDLPPNQYDLKGVRAEMKNGVLRVVVPKVKAEERSDVRQVQVQ